MAFRDGNRLEGHGTDGFNLFGMFNFFAQPVQASPDPNFSVYNNPEFTPGLDLATAPQPTFRQLDLFLNVYDNMREKARLQTEQNEDYDLNETDMIAQFHQFRANPNFRRYMEPIAQRLDRPDLLEEIPTDNFNGEYVEDAIQAVDEIYSQIEIEDRDQYLEIAGLAAPTLTPTLSRAQIDSFMTATADIADGEHTVTENYDVTPAILLARNSSMDIARQHAAAEAMSAEASEAFLSEFAAEREEVRTELENINAPVIPSTAEIASVAIYRDMDSATDLTVADAAGVERDVYVASLGPDADAPQETVDVAAELDATPYQAAILPEVVHLAQAEPAAEEPAELQEQEIAAPSTTPVPSSIIERTEPVAPTHTMVDVPEGGSLWQMVVDHYDMEDAKNSDIMKRIEEVAAVPENHELLTQNAVRAGRPDEVSAHYIYPGQEFKFPTEATLAAGPQTAPALDWRALDREWMPGMTPVGP